MIRNAVLYATSNPHYTNGKSITPLTVVDGSTLLERSLNALDHLGVRDVMVLTEDRILTDECQRRNANHLTARVRWIPNGPNALKRAANAYPNQMVLVTSTDVIFSPEMVVPILERRDNAPITLIDRRISRIYDLQHALHARTSGNRVMALGDTLENSDAIVVGISSVYSGTLRTSKANDHRELLATLNKQSGLLCREVAGSKWHVVDSPQTLRHADWLVRAYGPELRGEQERVPPRGVAQRVLAYIDGLLSEKRPRHNVLMNPGPVVTSPRVKSAMVHHDVCHRDEDYARVLRRLKRRLRVVCGGPDHDILLLSGSGTASMEAAISSFVPHDKKLLVVSNGAFGERCGEIATLHNIETIELRYPWGKTIDTNDVAELLEAHPEIFGVIMVHHETSVGLLNPVHEVGALCREHDRLFFVDAIASLGGEEIDVEKDMIDVLISSANKCLHAISGMSFACVGPRVWPRVEDIPPRVYYLDLKRYRKQLIPFTPAVSTCFALDAAVDELLHDGVAQRIRQYRAINTRIREALRRLGLARMTETGQESHTLTIFEVPSYVTFNELYEELKSRGYVIYGCKEHLKDRYFQIANMGELSDEMVEGFLECFETVLGEHKERAQPQLAAVI